jgi:hypothetical protein
MKWGLARKADMQHDLKKIAKTLSLHDFEWAHIPGAKVNNR